MQGAEINNSYKAIYIDICGLRYRDFYRGRPEDLPPKKIQRVIAGIGAGDGVTKQSHIIGTAVCNEIAVVQLNQPRGSR
jgi:hypothetical protein